MLCTQFLQLMIKTSSRNRINIFPINEQNFIDFRTFIIKLGHVKYEKLGTLNIDTRKMKNLNPRSSFFVEKLNYLRTKGQKTVNKYATK